MWPSFYPKEIYFNRALSQENNPPATAGAPPSDVKPSGPASSATGGVSTDKNRNYAVVAGTLAAVSAFGWWFLSKPKKSEEIVDWVAHLPLLLKLMFFANFLIRVMYCPS